MEHKKDVPFPPPDISDLLKNEELFGEVKSKNKENKEVLKLISIAITLNAECRRSRNKMWSDEIYHNFYGELMKNGRLMILPEKVKETKKKKDK